MANENSLVNTSRLSFRSVENIRDDVQMKPKSLQTGNRTQGFRLNVPVALQTSGQMITTARIFRIYLMIHVDRIYIYIYNRP